MRILEMAYTMETPEYERGGKKPRPGKRGRKGKKCKKRGKRGKRG